MADIVDPLDATLARILWKHAKAASDEIEQVFGAPLRTSLLAWVQDHEHLVNLVSSEPDDRRDELAAAMIELLKRWGWAVDPPEAD